MKPKKKDRHVIEQSKPQFDQTQADHELFLQAFEKPTQIYRYLRTRNFISPIFLHRTLNYMKGRCTRKANTRDNFKVDSLLARVEAKHKQQHQLQSYKSEYMNLNFVGFFEKGSTDIESVEVEVFLLKICHKKRKDVSSPQMEVSLGKVKILPNPEVISPSKMTVISIGSDHFSHSNGHSVRSYKLLLRVVCNRRVKHVISLCNGDSGHDTEETSPPSKRRRRNTNGSDTDMEDQLDVYAAELTIYDKHRRCPLSEGEYELALLDLGIKANSKKQASWETVMDGQAVSSFEVFSRNPTLKFRLGWNQLPINGCDTGEECAEEEEFLHNNNHIDNLNIVHTNNIGASINKSPEKRTKDPPPPSSSTKTPRIFYQFVNNNTRQQTEAREDMHCPWCALNCMQLYSLMKHHRTCHARFNIIYSKHAKGLRIDVSMNEHYDGAYVGNPQDLRSHVGYAFSRHGPVRRTHITHILVYRPKKPSFDLAEFLEPENEGARQLVQGHNRLYYHLVTSQPVTTCEIISQIEDEVDPFWLRQKTINLIDDFTDVNGGEKEVMKMWNLHIMHHNYIGDCNVPQACHGFVDEYGEEILQRALARNFLLHLSSLYDFGLLRPTAMLEIIVKLFRLRDTLESDGKLSPKLIGVYKKITDASLLQPKARIVTLT